MPSSWDAINAQLPACARCEDLRAYCAEVARVKRRAYRDELYWGRPVPNFGDPQGRILLLGLAPGAHGANRTGRLFTGDASGDFLFEAMHAVGLANQPDGRRSDDGLTLIDCAISCSAHCAPPANKPTRTHLDNCSPWMEATLRAMPRLKVICCLGAIAFTELLRVAPRLDWEVSRPRPKFSHGRSFDFIAKQGGPTLLCSYHPSQQNVNTGLLTQQMLRGVLQMARDAADTMERTA